VIDTVNEYPATVFSAYLALLALIAWVIVWTFTAWLTQQYSFGVAYGLSVFLIFAFYWTTQVIKNTLHVTVSGVFATVYFMKGSPYGMPENPTVDSFKRASTTSFGSICLGSLLVAILQTIRALLRGVRTNNGALGLLVCFIDCILSCIEALLKYFNHYAFAQVAIYGKTFCQAAKATWELIFSHGFEAIVNDNLIDTVLWMGCLLGGIVTAVGGGLTAFVIVKDFWVLCAVVSFFIGYMMLAIISEVIMSGTATYFVCFAQDPAILRRNNEHLYHKLRETYNLSWV